jgi:DNA-binding NtrC family response regulator
MRGKVYNRRVRILVVDPEDWCREFLSTVIRLCGFKELTLVPSVAEALAALEEGAFDLLIADLQDPDYRRLLEESRQRDPGIRYIFMLPQRGQVPQVVYLEHADIVFKPLSMDDIIRKIRNAIHQKNLRQAEEEIRRLKQEAFRILG